MKKAFFCTIILLAVVFSAAGCNSSTNNTVDDNNMRIAPYNQSVTLLCSTEIKNKNATYQWYESSDGSTNAGKIIQGATESTFTTPLYDEKGIHYYYCTATNKSTTSVSDVTSVAYTALPTVYINTPDSVKITSKEKWIENATISIVGAKNEAWNFENIETSIRGRGNTTWDRPKKPYAIKLNTSQKIMGMPKDKRWVLIANYCDQSFMRNEIALYLSELFKLGWTVHGEFADLVLNGKYYGLYWLGEAIRVDKNRVDINDGNQSMADNEDKDYLIEMQNMADIDDPVNFSSSIRQMPYLIKNDDYMIDENNELTSGGEARLERLKTKITDLETQLYPDFTAVLDTNECSAPDESYTKIIDIDSWIKFWLVNEIMDNRELGHPKSCFFTFDSTNNIFKAGPVWDFDLAAIRQASSCTVQNTIYYNALFKSPAFIKRTKELWSEYKDSIDIEPRVESMRTTIDTAVEYDIMLWGKHHDNPSDNIFGTFDEEVDFMKETVIKKINVVDKFINGL